MEPMPWKPPGSATGWGVGEVVNSTPLVFQGCMVVVSLSLILAYSHFVYSHVAY